MTDQERDNMTRDVYLRTRGWTPHLTKPGFWWFQNIHDPLSAKDAAAQQVMLDEACMIYLLDAMSPAARSIVHAHVVAGWLAEFPRLLDDPKAKAELVGMLAHGLEKPEVREAIKVLVTVVREIAR